ncbi:endonuclease/exonuclease/phosphatase family protein [Patescibacteria group bacterium]|nr:endonuclease/exonuclease/phosphatase family protein [Patescibacteria group bacterium]
MLRVISVNIEYDKHFDRVLQFLKAEQWDVLLVNELLATDVPKLEEALQEDCFFVPMMRFSRPYGKIPMGHGVFSRVPVVCRDEQYSGPLGEITDFIEGTSEERLQTCKNFLVVVEANKDQATYKIGFTHFPWTPDGEADNIQRVCAKALLEIIEREGEMVLFGDFNAPRGKEIFSMFAEKLKDNIPAQYETSLDENLHRAGKLTLMVDGCFTTPAYTASDVELRFGVSDHAAVLATISKI